MSTDKKTLLQMYRTMVTIPWSFFAGMSGVSKGEFYDAPDASSAPPQVSF